MNWRERMLVPKHQSYSEAETKTLELKLRDATPGHCIYGLELHERSLLIDALVFHGESLDGFSLGRVSSVRNVVLEHAIPVALIERLSLSAIDCSLNMWCEKSLEVDLCRDNQTGYAPRVFVVGTLLTQCGNR